LAVWLGLKGLGDTKGDMSARAPAGGVALACRRKQHSTLSAALLLCMESSSGTASVRRSRFQAKAKVR
jgi:hypothetical protein